LKSVSILGTVGVPANYGGFETLVENLVDYADSNNMEIDLSVYCSGKQVGPKSFKSASLRYVNMGANGPSSIAYDIASLFSAVKRKDDVILLLGVSGALALPIIRLISRAFIVTNIDGIEWKRDKWGRIAKAFLRISETTAVRFSHKVIADNQGIADHVRDYYGNPCEVIAYGGDHALAAKAKPYEGLLPPRYALALCRIEPENNVEMILEGFRADSALELVFIGNWTSSEFGRAMKDKFSTYSNIHLLDPIYDLGVLKTIREGAYAYVHGHSAGGTNPSLVEMMHFGIPVFAFDCSFNRYTTDHRAQYFGSSEELTQSLSYFDQDFAVHCGDAMKKIAIERYTWAVIGKQYYDLLLNGR